MNDSETQTLDGFVDHVDWHGMRGWAMDRATPDEPLWLEVLIDELAPVAFLANMRRQDLVDAGFGRGTYAFELRFPQKLDPLVAHRVEVRCKRSGRALPNSPTHLAAAPMASADKRSGFEAAVEAEIAAAENGRELDATIGYLLQQVDKLLQGRAETASGATALHQFRLRWNDYLAGERAMPIQPDSRPWALIIDTELPETAAQLSILRAVQGLGYRVAVVGTRGLPGRGAVAHALSAMDVTTFGEPQFFTVEDVLRRHRSLFRAVICAGPLIAAAYAVVARIHQPRAKTIALLGDADAGRADQTLMLSAALHSECVVVETEALQQNLTQRLPGRRVERLVADADDAACASVFARMLPRLRMVQPTDANPPAAPDPA